MTCKNSPVAESWVFTLKVHCRTFLLASEEAAVTLQYLTGHNNDFKRSESSTVNILNDFIKTTWKIFTVLVRLFIFWATESPTNSRFWVFSCQVIPFHSYWKTYCQSQADIVKYLARYHPKAVQKEDKSTTEFSSGEATDQSPSTQKFPPLTLL